MFKTGALNHNDLRGCPTGGTTDSSSPAFHFQDAAGTTAFNGAKTI
jgi:hypothetical protein